MKTFILGDVHGRIKALKQVFERANFTNEDLLISLGDIVDRGDEPFECVEFLRQIPNKILIMGNHDYNFLSYAMSGHDGFNRQHGANITITQWQPLSYETRSNIVEFFESQVYYHVQDNKCFVHGGFDKSRPINDQSTFEFIWDRKLWQKAMSCSDGQKLNTVDKFDEIFLGHTPTAMWEELNAEGKQVPITKPMNRGDVWNLDTGAGFPIGKLTMMNLETKEYFQSDLISELYNEQRQQS